MSATGILIKGVEIIAIILISLGVLLNIFNFFNRQKMLDDYTWFRGKGKVLSDFFTTTSICYSLIGFVCVLIAYLLKNIV